MKKAFGFLILSFTASFLYGQSIDPALLDIKEKLDRVQVANASARLALDVEFIQMPDKYAEIKYQSGKTIEFKSDNFIIIPKRGLDFSLDELFRYKFMTVDRGEEMHKGKLLKLLNIIPLDKKADYAIMTMKIDISKSDIVETEITTKNEGTFQLYFEYSENIPFPSLISVEFEIDKMKIPLNFMGKDAEVDKQKLKSDGPKKGKIFLELNWQAVKMIDE